MLFIFVEKLKPIAGSFSSLSPHELLHELRSGTSGILFVPL